MRSDWKLRTCSPCSRAGFRLAPRTGVIRNPDREGGERVRGSPDRLKSAQTHALHRSLDRHPDRTARSHAGLGEPRFRIGRKENRDDRSSHGGGQMADPGIVSKVYPGGATASRLACINRRSGPHHRAIRPVRRSISRAFRAAPPRARKCSSGQFFFALPENGWMAAKFSTGAAGTSIRGIPPGGIGRAGKKVNGRCRTAS